RSGPVCRVRDRGDHDRRAREDAARTPARHPPVGRPPRLIRPGQAPADRQGTKTTPGSPRLAAALATHWSLVQNSPPSASAAVYPVASKTADCPRLRATAHDRSNSAGVSGVMTDVMASSD